MSEHDKIITARKARRTLLVQQLDELERKRREMLERKQQPRSGTRDLRSYVEPSIERIKSEIADIGAFLAEHSK